MGIVVVKIVEVVQQNQIVLQFKTVNALGMLRIFVDQPTVVLIRCPMVLVGQAVEAMNRFLRFLILVPTVELAVQVIVVCPKRAQKSMVPVRPIQMV